MRSKSWLEKKDEMLQTEKKHYEEYRGCNEYHTEHIVAGLNSFLELIELFFERFCLKTEVLWKSSFPKIGNEGRLPTIIQTY